MTGRGFRLAAHAATDQGLVREANEDSYFVGHSVFAVADGMGGHVAGEVASRKALEPIADLDSRQFPAPQKAQDALVEAITAANTAVVEKGDAEPELHGMGTTLTAVLVRDGRLHLAHVGDSRAYLLRDREPISQLTTDHTLVEQLVREGRLSREQAATHPQRSVVTRAIGVERQVKVDSLPPIELQPGDQVLLCSDGLTGPVDDRRITELLDSEPDGDAACQALVDEANSAGGPDNITVVLLRVEGSAPGAAGGGEDGRQRPEGDGETTGRLTSATRIRTREDSASTDDWAERMGRYGKTQGAEGTSLPTGRRTGRRTGIGRFAAIALGVVVLLALLGGGGYGLLSRAYFVGELDGQVTVFNGIPQTVAGLRLHWERESTDITTASLPEFRADRLREGVPAGSLTEAREIVERYREFAEDEQGTDPSDDPSPTPQFGQSPAPTGTPTP